MISEVDVFAELQEWSLSPRLVTERGAEFSSSWINILRLSSTLGTRRRFRPRFG